MGAAGSDARSSEAPNTSGIQASGDAADGPAPPVSATRRLSPRAARVVARAAHRPVARSARSVLARGARRSLAIAGLLAIAGPARAATGDVEAAWAHLPASFVEETVRQQMPIDVSFDGFPYSLPGEGVGGAAGAGTAPAPPPPSGGNARIVDVRYCGPDKSSRAGKFRVVLQGTVGAPGSESAAGAAQTGGAEVAADAPPRLDDKTCKADLSSFARAGVPGTPVRHAVANLKVEYVNFTVRVILERFALTTGAAPGARKTASRVPAGPSLPTIGSWSTRVSFPVNRGPNLTFFLAPSFASDAIDVAIVPEPVGGGGARPTRVVGAPSFVAPAPPDGANLAVSVPHAFANAVGARLQRRGTDSGPARTRRRRRAGPGAHRSGDRRHRHREGDPARAA